MAPAACAAPRPPDGATQDVSAAHSWLCPVCADRLLLCALVRTRSVAPLISKCEGVNTHDAQGCGRRFFPPLHGASLSSVTTTSPFDAWAVGSVEPAGGTASRTVILRWTGRLWVRVPSPNPGGDTGLSGVTATSRTSAFAVGAFTAGNEAVDSLVLRWDGRRWAQVTTPNPANLNRLNAVAADTPRDVWAVGTAEGSNVPIRAFAVHGF